MREVDVRDLSYKAFQMCAGLPEKCPPSRSSQQPWQDDQWVLFDDDEVSFVSWKDMTGETKRSHE